MSKSLKIVLIAVTLMFSINIFATSSICCAANVTQKQARDKINHLKKLEKAEHSKLFKNQQKLENASTNLNISKTKYSNAQSQLNQLENDFNIASREFNSLDAQLKNRIRNVFKSQRTGMFQLILSTQDFNSFMDIIYFERLILKRDYRRMITMKQKAQRIAQMKRDIELQKRSLAQSIRVIDSQQKDIQKAIAQNQNMINRLQHDRRYYEKAERELARQSSTLQTMISHSAQDSTVKVSSGFIKPIGGRITSPFGWRTHPIFHSRTFHSGVDIGGPNYGNIIASNSGKVIYSGWYGGYGKVVIIDHGVVNGKPMTTLYAHMSSTKVNQGQYVQKGQIVGKEGTTGYSTGPHCHFEIRINGKPNNPMSYI